MKRMARQIQLRTLLRALNRRADVDLRCGYHGDAARAHNGATPVRLRDGIFHLFTHRFGPTGQTLDVRLAQRMEELAGRQLGK